MLETLFVKNSQKNHFGLGTVTITVRSWDNLAHFLCFTVLNEQQAHALSPILAFCSFVFNNCTRIYCAAGNGFPDTWLGIEKNPSGNSNCKRVWSDGTCLKLEGDYLKLNDSSVFENCYRATEPPSGRQVGTIHATDYLCSSSFIGSTKFPALCEVECHGGELVRIDIILHPKAKCSQCY